MAELNVLPVATRLCNMALSYGQYITQTFVPANLAIVYPYNPDPWLVDVGVAAALLIAISVFAWRARTRFPWFVTGWLWFLGVLIPTIGLVQVGQQAHADRYTYLPSIGLLVLVVWTVAALIGRIPQTNPHLQWSPTIVQKSVAALAFLVLLTFSVATRSQLAFWGSSETLMRHAIAVAEESELAVGSLAGDLLARGDLEKAVTQYRVSLRLNGTSGPSTVGLGIAYAFQGKTNEAERLFRRALAIQPNAATHFQLADFLQAGGRFDEAQVHYVQGLTQAPWTAKARNSFGNLLARQNKWLEAREQIERALRLNPNIAEVHRNLGALCALQGSNDQAIVRFSDALKLQPAYPSAHDGLGLAWRVRANRKRQSRTIGPLWQPLMPRPVNSRRPSKRRGKLSAWLFKTGEPPVWQPFPTG